MAHKEHLSRDDLEESDFNSVAKELGIFLAITEDILVADFKRMGLRYTCPTLALADKKTRSQLGQCVSEGGPAYYPFEKTIYIDPAFYREVMGHLLPEVRKATIAYNLFHEVGHHVQNLRRELPATIARKYKIPEQLALVASELQADCISGMLTNVAHLKQPLLDKGDKEHMLTSAWLIGDDVLADAKETFTTRETMTHGSGAMRRDAVALGLTLFSLNQVPSVMSFAKSVLERTGTTLEWWL